MKQQKKVPINLRDAFSPTPDMCRGAVLHAVSTYREEKRMKKTSVIILVAAIALILACGTAVALVSYFSVRDSIADGQTIASFDEHITSIGEAKQSNGFQFTLTDAVFDGSRFAAAMNISAAEDAQTLYLFPTLEAWSGDEKLDIDFRGVNDRYPLGFLYPSLDPKYPMADQLAFNADVYSQVSGDIQWKLGVNIYRPLWKIVDQSPDDQSEQLSRSAFLNEQIVVYAGHTLDNYQYAVFTSPPEWVDHIRPYLDMSFPEAMEKMGAVELVDTVEFDFTLSSPVVDLLPSGQVFSFDEYDVEITSLTQSFMQIDYELKITFPEKQTHEIDLETVFDLLDQNGQELKWRRSASDLLEDKRTVRVYGSVERISDEPLTSITFRPSKKFTSPGYFEKNAERLSFTVECNP